MAAPIVLGLHLVTLLAISVYVLRIAWVDFQTLTISNTAVLWMLALAAGVSLTRQPPSIVADLILGAVLFACGFLMWLMGGMGAGDAKLYLPLGIALGPLSAPPYIVALLFFSVLFLIAAKIAARFDPAGPFLARLAELGRGKGLPYAVPMALAYVFAVTLTLVMRHM